MKEGKAERKGEIPQHCALHICRVSPRAIVQSRGAGTRTWYLSQTEVHAGQVSDLQVLGFLLFQVMAYYKKIEREHLESPQT